MKRVIIAAVLFAAPAAHAQWSSDVVTPLAPDICELEYITTGKINLFWDAPSRWMKDDQIHRENNKHVWLFGGDAGNPHPYNIFQGYTAKTVKKWCNDDGTWREMTINEVETMTAAWRASLARWRQRHMDCARNGFVKVNVNNGDDNCTQGSMASVPVDGSGNILFGDDCQLALALQKGQTQDMDVGTGNVWTCDATGPGDCCGLVAVILDADKPEGIHSVANLRPGAALEGPNVYLPDWREDYLQNFAQSFQACNDVDVAANVTVTHVVVGFPSTDIKVAGMLNPYANREDRNAGTCEVYSSVSHFDTKPPDWDQNGGQFNSGDMAQQLTQDVLTVTRIMTQPKTLAACGESINANVYHCSGVGMAGNVLWRPGSASGPEITVGHSQYTGSIVAHSMGAIATKFWGLLPDVSIGSLAPFGAAGLRNNSDPIPWITRNGMRIALWKAASEGTLLSCDGILRMGCGGARRCAAGNDALMTWIASGGGCVFTKSHKNDSNNTNDPTVHPGYLCAALGPSCRYHSLDPTLMIAEGSWINMPLGGCTSPGTCGQRDENNTGECVPSDLMTSQNGNWTVSGNIGSCGAATCDTDETLVGPGLTQIYTGSHYHNPCEELDATQRGLFALDACKQYLTIGGFQNFWNCAFGVGDLARDAKFIKRAIGDHGWISDWGDTKGGGYKQAAGELWSRTKVLMSLGGYSDGNCGLAGVGCMTNAECCNGCNYQRHQCM